MLLFNSPLDGWLQKQFIPIGFIWSIFVVYAVADTGAWTHSFLKKIGQWSYPIYLFHELVLTVLHKHLVSGALSFFLGLILCVFTGAIIHQFLEVPMEKGRHILMKKLRSMAN